MFSWKPNQTQQFSPTGMTLEQVREAMLQLLAQENLNHHHMGQLYNYAVDARLAENAGHPNALAYFAKEVADLSQASLSMYGTVAAAFTEECTSRFGVTCLSLLLTYQEVAEVQVDHAAPGGTIIEVLDDTGAVVPKRFGDCSVLEMRKALQRKRKPSSSKPLPPSDVELVDEVRKAVVSRFDKGVPVRVQVRNRKGKTLVDFKGIPVELLSRLGEVLLSPPPEVLQLQRQQQQQTPGEA